MLISDWSSDVCSSDLACCEHAFQAAARSDVRSGRLLRPSDRAVDRRRAGADNRGDGQAGGAAPGNHPPPLPFILCPPARRAGPGHAAFPDFGGVDSRSEEYTSELQSLLRISYAVFCLKKKT